MEGMQYFYELFEALPRGGPGSAEDTRKAFNLIPNPPEEPLILDIGCGPGPQTIELAKITNGKIIAIDNHQGFLDKLIQRVKKGGFSEKITVKNMSMLEMDFDDKTFDIIWSEGALYFMGFQNGLKKCRKLLKENGYLAVSEFVYLVPNPPKEVVEFSTNEFSEIRDIPGNIKLIENEGFRLLSHFTLPESDWLISYYAPMQKEILRMREKYKDNKDALATFDMLQYEINFYKKYSKYYGYEFFVMGKGTSNKL